MHQIAVQSPDGERLIFPDREELSRAIGAGVVRGDWTVFHAARATWVALAVHPVYRSAAPATVTRRSSDLVLIYPDGSTRVRCSGAETVADTEPSAPAAAPQGAGPRRSNPFLDSAARALPTFSRAVLGVAAIVQQRQA